MSLQQPPQWSSEQFDEQRDAAIELFREQRMLEDLGRYSDEYEDARQAVAALLELTVDLTLLRDTAVAVSLVADEAFLRALRYLAGPPISEDDLKTLADTNSLNPIRVRDEPWRATEVVETVLLGLDSHRFPWVSDDRDPTEAERQGAIIATAALIAQRRTMTTRAHESKNLQEEAVGAALVRAGLRQVSTRDIPTFSQAPKPGEFCHESSVGGRKADLVARLWDGRLMPIECKVSNSSTNSVKRLNNDAAVKAGTWIEQFGSAQTVPAAVLSGVYKSHNLVDAQRHGLIIFWAHDLGHLVRFIETTA